MIDCQWCFVNTKRLSGSTPIEINYLVVRDKDKDRLIGC